METVELVNAANVLLKFMEENKQSNLFPMIFYKGKIIDADLGEVYDFLIQITRQFS